MTLLHSFRLLYNKIFACFFALNIVLAANASYGNDAIKELINFENIVLVKIEKNDNGTDYAVVDIIKGGLDVNSFNLLKASTGFSADSENGLILFYFNKNEFDQIKLGAVKINANLNIIWKDMINDGFNLMSLYNALGLNKQNHDMPEFFQK